MTPRRRILIIEDEPNVRRMMHPSIDLAVDAMRLGATGFIRKPLTPDILRAAVEAAMRVRPGMTVPAASAEEPPAIETLTLNGFRILHLPSAPDDCQHRFRVTQGADQQGPVFVVPIEPSAVERLNQFTGPRHPPGGSFWASRAEELLAAMIWTEGHLPPPGTLKVKDFSRLELDSALAWPKDTL